MATRGDIVEYIYRQPDGTPYLRVRRLPNKAFPQSHWNGSTWAKGKPKGPKIPYRLPELIAATVDQPVFVCEGEKDADRLAGLGFVATTASEGAGKWKPDLNQWFANRVVYVLADNDEKGASHARQVADNLTGCAAEVRIVNLPDLPPKGDISDWLDAGNDPAGLVALCRTFPIYNGEPDHADEIRPPEFSDDALALVFAEAHKNYLRYVAAWGKWMVWNGTVWRQDDKLRHFHLARVVCREAAAACDHSTVAKAMTSAKTEAAVVTLARSDPCLAATADQWDSDPWQLNTPDGVVDLRTGVRRNHKPEDYLTRITAAGPGGDCPIWLKVLARATNDDPELQRFLQRSAGYALTGLTTEHALFLLYGTGANGKSVFLNTIAGILDDYHRTSPIEAFTATYSDRHPTDLASLRGARLVTATETEEGRRWAESKIKALTGGDKIAARLMRQDFFEFTPQFKLFIAGNHKPGLRSVDEAIRRRLHLIPFTVTIPPEERDKDLGEKLKAEWSGILQWMIDGCLEWQRHGLAPPEGVTKATAAYLDAQDTIAAWIEECCDLDPNAWERTATLFASWRGWAERSGEHVGDTKQFRERLEARNIFHRPERQTKRAGYQGIRLKQGEASGDSSRWS